jgi:hypothetical protein
MHAINRVGLTLGISGLIACSNGGKVFDSLKNEVDDSGTGSGGAGNGGTGPSSGTGGTSDGGAVNGGAGTGGLFIGSGSGVIVGGSGGANPTRCEGACCPTAAECYSDPTQGSNSPGSECLATQDNTGRDHIQLRQQWIHSTMPDGNAAGLVYAVLAGRSELPWKACNQTGAIGSGGYIELMDFFLGGADKSQHYATTGFARFVPGPTAIGDPAFTPAVVQTGFCYGIEDYAGDPAYRLAPDQVGDGAGFPLGLQRPMSLQAGPWKVGPTKSKRLDADFDLTSGSTRSDLLAQLDPTGEYGSAGFDGVFYYDEATGTAHGYSPLSWVVIYDAMGTMNTAVPIREAETRNRFNDPAHPNCMGAYLTDNLDPATCLPGQDPNDPGWGGGDCSATTGSTECQPGQAPASTSGYYLISELEQVYSPDLQNTLCVTYPGTDPATARPRMEGEGFYDPQTSSCMTAKWNPADPMNGLPRGDWCAATNSPATASCHDAWRGISFHVFAGAKIAVTASDTPASCAF